MDGNVCLANSRLSRGHVLVALHSRDFEAIHMRSRGFTVNTDLS